MKDHEIEFQYGINADTYRLVALIKCVSNDMQRLLTMPLSHEIKESAMHEMCQIIVDNIG